MRVLRAEGAVRAPAPSAGAFERAMRVAMERPPAAPRQRHGFWLGAAVGGALAASLAIAIVLVVPGARAPVPAATPQVRLAPNETRELHISLAAPRAMRNASIRVVLSGTIGLAGFDGRKEVAWQTDLDRGVNELSLPIVALGADGGQVVVEVRYADKRKRFLVDVPPASEEDAV
jgi:hypothetical protein